VGIAVLLIDALKGAAPMVCAGVFLPHQPFAATTVFVAVILGHNFSPWIGFRGGRGLATAAGASLVFDAHIFLLWIVFWVVFFLPKRNVHIGNIFATLCTPLGLAALSGLGYAVPVFQTPTGLHVLVATVICIIILIGHRNVIAAFVNPK
jgi:glycerol-3-phosphate acyltransferase PlsY